VRLILSCHANIGRGTNNHVSIKVGAAGHAGAATAH